MDNYEKIVLEQHKPKVSERKRAELELKIMSLKTSPRVKKDDFKHENDQNEGAKMDENY